MQKHKIHPSSTPTKENLRLIVLKEILIFFEEKKVLTQHIVEKLLPLNSVGM
jgi:hypothetical protein